jgi:hypothetical protein
LGLRLRFGDVTLVSMRWVAMIGMAMAVWAQTPEQTEILARARAAALEYSKSLPDFLCTEMVRRFEDPYGSNRWRPLDTLAIKISYSGHEQYQLVSRNGGPTPPDLESAGGAISSGEFGTRLVDIFDQESATEFAWKGWGRVRRQRVAVFTYRVDQPHSRNRITFGDPHSRVRAVVAAFHGEISVDPESGAALRITLTAEMPLGFPITACSSWTEYDYRDVAGRRFLLPVASESRMEEGRYLAMNQIAFRDYRKFQTETNITFK